MSNTTLNTLKPKNHLKCLHENLSLGSV
jgi:hypothetical protein